MVRFIIPQSDAVSPVDIRSSHWHKYLGDIIKDYILTGLGLSAGAGLNVNVAAGRGYIRGIDFESDAVESVAVVASATNHIFGQLLFDGELEPTGWQFVVNQTGTPPADSILLGTATTNGSGVTGTSTSTTQQGMALKNFAVGTIKALQGNTAVIFGNNLDANGQRIIKTGSLHFDPSTIDLDSFIMGSRAANLSISSAADGTIARQIRIRTPTVVTAGHGTPADRIQIGAGAAVVDIDIVNAELDIGANKLKTTTIALREGSADFIHFENLLGTTRKSIAIKEISMRNPAQTFSYIIKGGAIVANRDVSLPVLAANDVFVTEAHPQSLTGKTMVDPALRFINRTFEILGPDVDLWSVASNGSGSVTSIKGLIFLRTGTTTGGDATIWRNAGAAHTTILKRGRKFEFYTDIGFTTMTALFIEVTISDFPNKAAKQANNDEHATFLFDPAVSANWITKTADGTTLNSKTSTEAVIAGRHHLAIINDETTIFFYVDGVQIATHDTNLPGLTTVLGWGHYVENTEAVDKGLDVAGAGVVTDIV